MFISAVNLLLYWLLYWLLIHVPSLMQSWVIPKQTRPPPSPRGGRRSNPSTLPAWPPRSCLHSQQVTWLFYKHESRWKSNSLGQSLACVFCHVTPSWVDCWLWMLFLAETKHQEAVDHYITFAPSVVLLKELLMTEDVGISHYIDIWPALSTLRHNLDCDTKL